jgi:hypothetical protein
VLARKAQQAMIRTLGALSALLDLTSQISYPDAYPVQGSERGGLLTITDAYITEWELSFSLSSEQLRDVLDFMIQEGIIADRSPNDSKYAGPGRWRYNGPQLGSVVRKGYNKAVATAFFNALSKRFMD